jgi:hypothetical protein
MHGILHYVGGHITVLTYGSAGDPPAPKANRAGTARSDTSALLSFASFPELILIRGFAPVSPLHADGSDSLMPHARHSPPRWRTHQSLDARERGRPARPDGELSRKRAFGHVGLPMIRQFPRIDIDRGFAPASPLPKKRMVLLVTHARHSPQHRQRRQSLDVRERGRPARPDGELSRKRAFGTSASPQFARFPELILIRGFAPASRFRGTVIAFPRPYVWFRAAEGSTS